MKRVLMAVVVAALATFSIGLFVGSASAASSCYPVSCPGASGSGRTITGSDWCPGSTVKIYVDGSLVGTATVDANGNFTFTLPSSVPPGTHTITVKGLDASCQTNRTVTFTDVLGATGGTAVTGADLKVGALAAVALMFVGAGALLAGRRRRVAINK
jgi:Bacterial Ig domain